MKKGLMLEFSLEEYKKRLKKIIKGMEKKNLDGIILTSDENTYYFSGFNSIVWDSKVSTPGVLVITREGDMVISSSKGGLGTAEATSCVDEFEYYGKDSQYNTYAESIFGILEKRNIQNGRIGFEIGLGHKMHLNHNDREDLFALLQNGEIVDASDILWEVRSIKSDREIERIKKCCDINIRGIEKGFYTLKEGMTELDLYRNIISEYFELGGEKTLPIGVRAGEDRITQSNCPPSNRKIIKGDLILVDGGPVYKGYYSDIIRQAVIGKPKDIQLEMFNVAREACYVGIEKMKPGIPICQVTKAVSDYLNKSKFKHLNIYGDWCGHSIGCGVHELPMLDDREDILKPGMIFAIEPNLTDKEIGNVGIEENILITEKGNEILTPLDSHLYIL